MTCTLIFRIAFVCLLLATFSVLAGAADNPPLTTSQEFKGTPDQAYNAVYRAVADNWQLRNASAKRRTIRFLDAGPDRARFDQGAEVKSSGDGKTEIFYILAAGKAEPSQSDLMSNAKTFFKYIERFKEKPIDPFVAGHGEQEVSDAYEFLAREYDIGTVYAAGRQIAQSQGTVERADDNSDIAYRAAAGSGKGSNLICLVHLVDQGNREIRMRMRFRSADGGRVYLSETTERIAKEYFDAVRSALVPMTQNPADSPHKRE